VAVEFFTVSKSYSMPGWRVGFCVGNPDMVGALATIKGYYDYGTFAPTQLAAATALATCDADVQANRDRYRHRASVLCDALDAAGWAVPRPTATMFVWAPIPARFASLGAVGFATELLERAGVAVAPGVGFGPGGEGFVRFSLIEPDERVRAACAAIGKFLAG
jgi:alanine-synthesizing transaminase